MSLQRFLSASVAFLVAVSAHAANYLEFKGQAGPGKGKHVVLIAGDEEYRSEEAMPMLGKILSQRHGFDCTVLFSASEDGTVEPKNQQSLTNPEALSKADAIVMLIRFRKWSPGAVELFNGAVNRGVPIIGLRTSTHAFNEGELKNFGKQVLGEGWVSHWGKHKFQATRGVVEPSAAGKEILHGVGDIFGNSDVYEAYPPADSQILVRGQVLKGMAPTDEADDSLKQRASDKASQGINDPMMPVVWIREVPNAGGSKNRVMCSTMGAATDLASEGLRRLVVNGVFWGLKLPVPAKADVSYVDPYEPTMYGFGTSIPGLKVDDLGLGKSPKK